MAEPDFDDIYDWGKKDKDVDTLVSAVKTVLHKYGAFLTARTVALLLAPYKRSKFEEKLNVKESRSEKFSGYPSDLTGKDISDDDYFGELNKLSHVLDHSILWQRQGKLVYLTSEPYYASKEDLRSLIEHCDKYGIDFQIDAESCYYPGHAIRILFKRGHVSHGDAVNHLAGETK